MKKANKTRFLILLGIALAFIAGTFALLFIPEPKPLKVTEKVTLEIANGEYIVHGKIKNVTKSEIILDAYSLYAEIGATTESGGKIGYIIRLWETVALQPDEELDLSAMRLKLSGLKDVKMSRLVYESENVGITLYGNIVNSGIFSVFALLTGIIGVAFLIIATVSYIVDVNNVKRVNNIVGLMNQTFENAIYAAGKYGNLTEERLNAAKTTASVIGAAVSAFFVGIGRYKIYLQGYDREFIITETSIYMYIGGKFSKFVDVTNEIKADIVNPSLAEKKNKIIVKGDGKNVVFKVKLKDGSAEKAQALNHLKNIFGI